MTVATSAAQRRAFDDGSLPQLERIRDNVWALATPMPGGVMGLRYTLTYLLRSTDGHVHVVDPGWDSDDNAALLAAALDRVGGPLGSIIVTHLHPDHLAMAPRLREHCGAPIVMHEKEVVALGSMLEDQPVELEGWGVPPGRRPELDVPARSREAYRPVNADLVIHGAVDALSYPGLPVEVLHTPGHTTGHICLRLPTENLLLTGDHVLPASYPGLGLGGPSDTNPIADHLESLALLTRFDDHEVLPGHQYRFTGLAERIGTVTGHHARRTSEVRAVIGADPAAAVYQVAAALTWSRGWEEMRGFLLYSALAQTAMRLDLISTTTTTNTQPLTMGPTQ